MEQSATSDQYTDLTLSQLKEIVRLAVDNNSPAVKALIKASGYYDKILNFIPRVISICLQSEDGLSLLKEMGIMEILEKISNGQTNKT